MWGSRNLQEVVAEGWLSLHFPLEEVEGEVFLGEEERVRDVRGDYAMRVDGCSRRSIVRNRKVLKFSQRNTQRIKSNEGIRSFGKRETRCRNTKQQTTKQESG